MAKGSKFLQIVGIVMIVCGGIATIVDLLAVVGALFGGAILAVAGVNPTMLILQTIVALLSAVAMLVAGILGVVNHNKTEKAQVCFIFGIIVAALSVVANVVLALAAGSGIGWLGLLCGLVLPGLYIYGALLNKRS